MNEPLDELYLNWLYSQVSSVKLRHTNRTYWSLLRQLHDKEFVWIIPNDDNRVQDGLDIRHEFAESATFDGVDPMWMSLGCSMLEMLLGLSRRLSFEADGESRTWFWHMIETLGILCSDKDYNDQRRDEIDEALDRVIFRTYDPDGHGGLFPLEHPTKNQVYVELWYQLSAYILELELV